MGFIVPRRSFCRSGAFVQNRPRSSLDYKIGWFRKCVVLQAGKWGQMRHGGTNGVKNFPRKMRKKSERKNPSGKIRVREFHHYFLSILYLMECGLRSNCLRKTDRPCLYDLSYGRAGSPDFIDFSKISKEGNML